MGRYRVTYTDRYDAGCPDFRMVLRAEDREHAELRFREGDPSGDPDDWTIVKIERICDEAHK